MLNASFTVILKVFPFHFIRQSDLILAEIESIAYIDRQREIWGEVNPIRLLSVISYIYSILDLDLVVHLQK